MCLGEIVCKVALSTVGIGFGTMGKRVMLINVEGNWSGLGISTGVAVEKRTLKPIMLRAQNKNCMISFFIL